MMDKHFAPGLVLLAGGVFLIVASAGSAKAQVRNRFSYDRRQLQRPAVSPYLNLLRGGVDNLEFQYFRRTQPELEFRQNAAQLHQSVENLQNEINRPAIGRAGQSGLTPSGHSTTFMNLGGFFGQGGQQNAVGGGATVSGFGGRAISAGSAPSGGGIPQGRRSISSGTGSQSTSHLPQSIRQQRNQFGTQQPAGANSSGTPQGGSPSNGPPN